MTIVDGSYVGPSSCDAFTSSLGSGQNVLSYTYYTPWRTSGSRYNDNGRPSDGSAARYAELLLYLASTIANLYPAWRMRIYHNVTDDQPNVLQRLCKLYCDYDHVDLCDTRSLPTVGDLNEKFPVGRFWRFQVLGDPTVRKFASRDVDSWILPRERLAVLDWERDEG